MKVIVKARVAGKTRRVNLTDDVFDEDEGATDSNGTLLCPICGCCQLVQAEAKYLRGEPYGLVCKTGCTKLKRHAA